MGDRVAVIVKIPAEMLLESDYHLRLSGRMTGGPREPIGRYYFRALKR